MQIIQKIPLPLNPNGGGPLLRPLMGGPDKLSGTVNTLPASAMLFSHCMRVISSPENKQKIDFT